MASQDDYSYAAQLQGSRLRAERMRALAELEEARADGNTLVMGECEQTIADIDQKGRNLNALHEEYRRSLEPPPAPPEPTAEERFARPWDRMTWDDALDLARTSQYGKDLDHNDPNVQAGYREVARRRSRGE